MPSIVYWRVCVSCLSVCPSVCQVVCVFDNNNTPVSVSLLISLPSLPAISHHFFFPNRVDKYTEHVCVCVRLYVRVDARVCYVYVCLCAYYVTTQSAILLISVARTFVTPIQCRQYYQNILLCLHCTRTLPTPYTSYTVLTPPTHPSYTLICRFQQLYFLNFPFLQP